MLRFVYTLLLYVLQPVLLLFMLLRSIKAPHYRQRLAECYGFYTTQAPKPQGIVVHAASVGEVIAATPLIKKLLANYPHLSITVTTFTPTGSERVKATFGQQVQHVYLPFDLPCAVARFIRFTQPKLCILIETEIWVNLISQMTKCGIDFAIVNARLSARSTERYTWFKSSLQTILNKISLIAAQDRVSAERYLQLGVQPERLQITGNLKFDLNLEKVLLDKIAYIKQQWQLERPVWIAASTHMGEDEIVLSAHRQLLKIFPNLLLILVPRHPERFQSVAELIEQQGFTYLKRSAQQPPRIQTQVLLGDTMGELMLFYGLAQVALVGGSLIERGGHNPLEPLAFQIPVLSGKYTFNFPEIFKKLLEVNGIWVVESEAKTLASAVEKLLDSPELQQTYAQAGYEVLLENRGSLQRLLEQLEPYLRK